MVGGTQVSGDPASADCKAAKHRMYAGTTHTCRCEGLVQVAASSAAVRAPLTVLLPAELHIGSRHRQAEQHHQQLQEHLHVPVNTPPTIVCQGSCSCYEHLILDGFGLHQNCSKADTFRQGGMVKSPKRMGNTETQPVADMSQAKLHERESPGEL